MRKCGAALFAVAMATLMAGSVAASVTVEIPVEKEAILGRPHKKNNDGSWGYGWVRTTARTLIGFDINPLEGFTVERARIKVYVAINNFTATGQLFVAHPWDPAQGVTAWEEGDNLFNSFSYCNDTSLAVPAHEVPASGEPDGNTWNCSVDPNYLSPGAECSGAAVWAPDPQSRPQVGFMEDIDHRLDDGENGTLEYRDSCAVPVTDGNTCDPSCSASRTCLTQPGKTVADCWRTVTIDVTSDVQDAVTASPDFDKVSWLIKRQTESAAGAFHFFSREGAICILGIRELQPVLEVTVQGSTAPEVDPPDDHCVAYD